MATDGAPPSIIVVGAGRVGTYLACKFAKAGNKVLLKGSQRASGKTAVQVDIGGLTLR